ncbi:MAG TPA: response regulator transcription factor [Dehalococcoidia bacterium]|nr:response regulator transcription factor [Dehalococcoidia bacterium]
MSEQIRILIADDHPVVREGLTAMISGEDDFEVVGEATNGLEAVDKSLKIKPDVVLMDLRMPGLDGVEAIRQIAATDPNIKFIILTTFSDDEGIFRGIEVGARAYLLKDAPREQLFKAIRAVYRGESLIQPVIASKVLDRFAELSRQSQSPETLTEREVEVLNLVAKGSANKEIAASLNISNSTVKTHIASIFQKLGANDRTEAVTQAIRRGIIRLQ